MLLVPGRARAGEGDLPLMIGEAGGEPPKRDRSSSSIADWPLFSMSSIRALCGASNNVMPGSSIRHTSRVRLTDCEEKDGKAASVKKIQGKAVVSCNREQIVKIAQTVIHAANHCRAGNILQRRKRLARWWWEGKEKVQTSHNTRSVPRRVTLARLFIDVSDDLTPTRILRSACSFSPRISSYFNRK